MKSEKQIEEFEKLLLQIEKLLSSFVELSKKKPTDAVNKFKLKFVNTLISLANTLLTKQYLPFDGFSGFDEDELPNNSDVVLMLTQYCACLKKFGRNSVVYSRTDYNHYWVINGQVSDVVADYESLKEKVK